LSGAHYRDGEGPEAIDPNGNNYNKDHSESGKKVAPGGQWAHRTEVRGESLLDSTKELRRRRLLAGWRIKSMHKPLAPDAGLQMGQFRLW
jgi:hypothetical protein